MFERLLFLLTYVGSAAMVAFLAVCVTSPQIATFNCTGSGLDESTQCELVDTSPVAAQESAPASSPRRATDDMPIAVAAMQ